MTTWSDYQTLPTDNNSPPPVGAPEGMAPSSVDDTMREMMSVIRQLGDQAITNGLNNLGTMADQNANAVNITGGVISGVTLAGDGTGVYNLQSAYLQGPIPSACLSNGTYYDISVAEAADAGTVGGIQMSALLPIGIITMFYGSLGSIDTAIWALCDGTRGTPDLRNRFVLGVGDPSGFGAGGGGPTDQQGSHAHGGNTDVHVLSLNEIPPHDHGGMSQHSFLLNEHVGGGIAQGPYLVSTITPTMDGGGSGHVHPIGADGVHQHNQSLPPYFGLMFIMRVA